MDTEIIVALIALLGGGITAWVGLAGRRSEARASETDSLIKGQGARIERLEERTDRLEKELADTRRELTLIDRHASDVRDALRFALAWIADALAWMRTPVGEPPDEPDWREWQALLVDPPTMRR